MEDKQYIKQLIKSTETYEIEKYKSSDFSGDHTPFEGTPKRHSNDKILILLTNPFISNNVFYEFPMDSIRKIEDLGTISSENGKNASRVRIWIKKGMPGVKSEPFIVE